MSSAVRASPSETTIFANEVIFLSPVFFFLNLVATDLHEESLRRTHFHPKGLLAVVTVFKKERILLTSEPLKVCHSLSLFTYTKIIVVLQQNGWAHYALVRNIQNYFLHIFFFSF